MQLEETLRT